MGYILHEYAASGNCYKIRLLAALIGQPIERREYDIMRGETRTPEFLGKINANGRIPVLEVDGGRMLPESNAALFYLAQGTPFWQEDPFSQAQVLQWLFFEQYNHEPNVATVRFWLKYLGRDKLDSLQQALLPKKIEMGHAALAVMDQQLAQTPWLVGNSPTIADLALYAYTHFADEVGFDLDRFPALQVWLKRVAALPGYVSYAA